MIIVASDVFHRYRVIICARIKGVLSEDPQIPDLRLSLACDSQSRKTTSVPGIFARLVDHIRASVVFNSAIGTGSHRMTSSFVNIHCMYKNQNRIEKIRYRFIFIFKTSVKSFVLFVIRVHLLLCKNEHLIQIYHRSLLIVNVLRCPIFLIKFSTAIQG